MPSPDDQPTRRRQDGSEEETVGLDSETEVADSLSPRTFAGALTVRDVETQPPTTVSPDPAPRMIGRYRVERRLGSGGFGVVYLAHDEQLDRRVAVKVPHDRLVATVADAGLYLAEARAVAQLDHPNILPVYDVSSSDRFPFFVVSKYIKAETLATRIHRDRPGWNESAEMVATIAEALHHAHSKGIIHRDIKPGNILIDPDGVPFVLDFGLALRDSDFGKGPRYVGTPAYMSPEQAWGEGHRLDSRSDVFSLGVVLYELLCGIRPFPGPTRELLMIQMTADEPRPPCQIDPSIPLELQRVCLKALAKRALDRYATAQAMAEDLRLFLVEHAAVSSPVQTSDRAVSKQAALAGDTALFLSRSLKVIPKGLRSFSERDADFFIELLPGPRDREGLPQSLRFWKEWVERGEPGPTAAIGLIYGPSGCGKSSLIKAGLIPRLEKRVLTVYVEAAPDETEARLLAGLRRRCPSVPEALGLKEALAGLRMGRWLPPGSKVLLVIDQFEQWLHARRGEEAPQLVQALRQCDGDLVQCLVMIRDDFWMAATRFMQALEVPLLEGHNSASVDLFDLAHARRVLAAFGQAYGKLEGTRSKARERDLFLSEAVEGLAQEGKVVCVRLALFAEMMKSREWNRTTLGEVGGASGVGFTFLETNFGSATAPPAHLRHEQASRAVLNALLPESGTDIKGHMRSVSELQDVSGYANNPREFEDLMRILDPELRLITPIDPEGISGDSLLSSREAPRLLSGERYYQLTHDYLVQSVSDWLTRKQRESRRGRAELCLQERASLWGGKPEARFLPSIGEWISIALLTTRGAWTETQRLMMRRAGWRYGMLSGLLGCAIGALAWGFSEARTYYWVKGKVSSLGTVKTSELDSIIRELDGVHRWADPQLRTLADLAMPESKLRLHISLALVNRDPSQVEYLTDRLLSADPDDVPIIRDALKSHSQDVSPRLWKVLQAAKGGDPSILRAAAALAAYNPGDTQWKPQAEKVAKQLVSTSAVDLGRWLEALRPVHDALMPPLLAIFHDPGEAENVRVITTSVLASYAADQPETLEDLLVSADPNAFDILFPVVKQRSVEIVPLLRAEVASKPEPLPTEPEADRTKRRRREEQIARKARAAAALVKLNQLDEVLPLLAHSADPRLRCSLIHWLPSIGFGKDPRVLAERLSLSDPAGAHAAPPAEMTQVLFDAKTSTRRATLMILGQYEPDRLEPELRRSVVARVLELFRNDPDAGVHSAAQWVLQRWGQEPKLQTIEAELAGRGIRQDFRWYVNILNMTFSLVQRPVEFSMGSGPAEPDRQKFELLHRRVIPRGFAIGTSEVTLLQYAEFLREMGRPVPDNMKQYTQDSSGPVTAPSWYNAAEFCNWLSIREGLQPCYDPNPQGKYEEGMRIPADVFSRNGYRLPTEAEWEYFCRSGTETGMFFGTDRSLFDGYAWFVLNSDGHSQPCGQKMPNDLGLFDTFGNVFEWCQDPLYDYRPGPDGKSVDAVHSETVLSNQMHLMLRGGSFGDLANELTAAHRIWNTPQNQLGGYGFRIARTIPRG